MRLGKSRRKRLFFRHSCKTRWGPGLTFFDPVAACDGTSWASAPFVTAGTCSRSFVTALLKCLSIEPHCSAHVAHVQRGHRIGVPCAAEERPHIGPSLTTRGDRRAPLLVSSRRERAMLTTPPVFEMSSQPASPQLFGECRWTSRRRAFDFGVRSVAVLRIAERIESTLFRDWPKRSRRTFRQHPTAALLALRQRERHPTGLMPVLEGLCRHRPATPSNS